LRGIFFINYEKRQSPNALPPARALGRGSFLVSSPKTDKPMDTISTKLG